jgi:hypothetical protein
MGKPGLPWKRGPAAWKIASNSEEIKIQLYVQPRKFLSLRKTAKLFGVSTQPIRDWVRLGHLKREGPRRQIALGELERFIGWLKKRAEPFDPQNYLERLPLITPFQKLRRAQFVWPKDRNALNPQELAALAGCHPSLILKAIHCGRLHGRHRSPCRFEVTRQAWQSRWFI